MCDSGPLSVIPERETVGLPAGRCEQGMRHEEFAERVVERLEIMAEATADKELRVGCGITAMRANELRVGARVVRDLSQVTTRKEQEKHLSLEMPL